MHFNNNREREINLRDLFFHILYRWRSIIAAALIGTILLSGGAFILMTTGVEEEEIPEEEEQYVMLTTSEDNYNDSIRIYQQLVDESNAYREKSILMKVDPFQVWRATAVYSVILDDGEMAGSAEGYDPALPIASVYPSLVYTDLDYNRLKKIYNVDDLRYISEIVSTSLVYDTSSFRIQTIGLTEEMALEGLAYFEEAVVKASAGEIQQRGRHHITRIIRYVRQVKDSDIEDKQVTAAKNIVSYLRSIAEVQNTAEKVAKQAEKEAEIEAEKEAEKEAEGANKIKFLVKCAVIGLFLGVLMIIVVYAARYLLSSRIRSGKEITELYGIPLFGEFRHYRGRHPDKGLDRLIGNWEFKNDKTDQETVMENICTLIRERKEGSRILLTGTVPDRKLKEFAGRLAEHFGEELTLYSEGGFLGNSRAVMEAAKADAVIIYEERYESGADDIRRMLEMMTLGKAPVIGAIVA